MIARVLSFSVRQRWLVVLFTAAAAAFGVWSMTKLPIDAVPDITNNQVQINTIAPLSRQATSKSKSPIRLRLRSLAFPDLNTHGRFRAMVSCRLPPSSPTRRISTLRASKSMNV